jgi:hypothetical protein
VVSDVGRVREPPEDRHVVHAPQRQHVALVLQQHDALLRGLASQLAMSFATDHVWRVVARIATLPELHQLPQDPQRSVVRDRFGNLAFLDQIEQEAVVHVGERHLDVLTGERRLLRITDREDPVGLHEALKAPLLLQDVGQQRLVLARPFAVQAVVGAHDGRGAFVHDALEVRQVDLVHRSRVGGDVHLEAPVLHRVEREVLRARHHVVLDAAHQGRTHLAQVVGVLAVALLRPAPGRVPQQVDARGADHVGAMGPRFTSHRVADPLLETGVPARPARRALGNVVAPSPWNPRGPSENLTPGIPRRGMAPAVVRGWRW